MMPMPPHIKDDAERALSERQASGEGHFRLCSLCGSAKWESTYHDRPKKAVIDGWIGDETDFIDGGGCSRCLDFSIRHPEVHSYLLRVISWQHQLSGALK